MLDDVSHVVRLAGSKCSLQRTNHVHCVQLRCFYYKILFIPIFYTINLVFFGALISRAHCSCTYHLFCTGNTIYERSKELESVEEERSLYGDSV